jgi:hypothetical protein
VKYYVNTSLKPTYTTAVISEECVFRLSGTIFAIITVYWYIIYKVYYYGRQHHDIITIILCIRNMTYNMTTEETILFTHSLFGIPIVSLKVISLGNS